MEETDGPQVIFMRRIHLAYLQLPVRTHPHHVREGLTRKNPLIIPQGLRLKIFDCVHGAGFVKPRQSHIEAIFDIDMEPAWRKHWMYRRIRESPPSNDGAQRSANYLKIRTRIPQRDSQFLKI